MTSEENIKERIQTFLQDHLKPSRLEHTYRVVEEAGKLAAKYGADPEKTELAALFHDACRNLPEPVMNLYIRRMGLPDKYLGNANLAHSKIAAGMMQSAFGITDQELLDAVSYHTTGRAGMTKLEKIIFLADAIEPGRHYPSVGAIRKAAEKDLDAACLLSLEGTIRFLNTQGVPIDEDTLQARDFFKENNDL